MNEEELHLHLSLSRFSFEVYYGEAIEVFMELSRIVYLFILLINSRKSESREFHQQPDGGIEWKWWQQIQTHYAIKQASK